MRKNCPESEQTIPLQINGIFGLPSWKRTNIISKFCWHCWHAHKHGVYMSVNQIDIGPNTKYICSACGHAVNK